MDPHSRFFAVIRWLKKNILPGVLVFFGLLLMAAVAGEVWLRITRPFAEPQWVSRFDPENGVIFVPGALIRHTNHLDFWAENRANHLGFLDREPPAAGSHASCRIAFFGDSFVEAAQVPVEKKFHVLLENRWNAENPRRKLETMAFGYSGTGQANQLPWLELSRPYEPNVIVLVFVSNDFANNNTWLEAARNGWHPFHPPRPFLYRDEGSAYRLLKPDPEWQKHLLVQTGNTPEERTKRWAYHKLEKNFYLYALLHKLWQLHANDASTWHSNLPLILATLRAMPEEKGRFGDWQPPGDLDMDQMFYAERMPPVFDEALADTEAALRLWKKEADAMGIPLVILATHSVEYSAPRSNSSASLRRGISPDRQLRRLEAIADKLGLPVINQAAYIRSDGGELKQASFPHDGHWNAYGHMTAAGAIKQYLLAHPKICGGSRP
jgi:hypothetical protein